MFDDAQVFKNTLTATATGVSKEQVWKAREHGQYLTRIDPELCD